MTAPDGWIKLRMVAGPDTTVDDMVWAGTVVVAPSDHPVGSGQGSPGTLLGVRGFTRPVAGDPPLEFVMAGVITPAMVQAVNRIPGMEEWQDVAARAVFRQVGRALITSVGTPSPADTLQALQLLFAAAKAETLAEIAAGRIPAPPLTPQA